MEARLEYTRFLLGVAFVKSQHLTYLALDSQPDSCIGCCTSNSDHHIPILITHDQHQTAVADAGITNADLFRAVPHPKLEFSSRTILQCLHGEARLRNAQLHVNHEAEWVCVDLYQAEIPTRVQRELRQLYQRHSALCDGDIYLKIRYYQRQQDHDEAERWLTKMTMSKRKIFGQVRRNAPIATALDDLEALPALWRGFQLGSFPPILSWRCHEEIGYYLRAIFLGWKVICADNFYWCDEKTVQRVEGLAPRQSLQHRSVIEDLHHQNQLFYRTETTLERDATARRLLDQKGMILSFGTFYKHVKLLENTMLGLRHLLPARKVQSTMMTALQSIYSVCNKGQAFVQYSDGDERYLDMPGLTRFEASYLQMILFGLRNRDAMASPKTRKEWASILEPPDWLVRMACLASKLGFESDEITDLQKLDPDRCRIKHHMHLERSISKFTVTAEDFELEASRRHREHRIFALRNEGTGAPSMVTALGGNPSSQQSSQTLFLPSILNSLQQQQNEPIPTSFGEEFSALCAFYGCFARSTGTFDDAAPTTRTLSIPPVEQRPPEPATIVSSSSRYSSQSIKIPAIDQRGASDTPSGHRRDPQVGHGISRSRRISFLELNAAEPPRVSHSCEASIAEVRSIMHKLQKSSDLIDFLLLHRGHLMISGAAAIYRRCVRQRRSNSIYYVTDAVSHYFWVGKSLNDAKKWRTHYKTDGPDRNGETYSEE